MARAGRTRLAFSPTGTLLVGRRRHADSPALGALAAAPGGESRPVGPGDRPATLAPTGPRSARPAGRPASQPTRAGQSRAEPSEAGARIELRLKQEPGGTEEGWGERDREGHENEFGRRASIRGDMNRASSLGQSDPGEYETREAE